MDFVQSMRDKLGVYSVMSGDVLAVEAQLEYLQVGVMPHT